MTNLGLAFTAAAGYVAYRACKAILEENRGPQHTVHRDKIHKAPPPEVGVDVSAKV